MLATQDVTIGGVRSVVHDTRPGGPSDAVVFVHGNPGPSDDWEGLAPRVAEFARVVAMDLPGYGRADHPREFDFTVDGYARHLGGILDAVGVRRAHLVLHDFGGPWGLAWAAERPERVASLTLINTGVLMGYRWHKYAKIWQTPLLGEFFQWSGTPALMHRAMQMDNPKPVPREFIDRIFSYADWGHHTAVRRLYRACRNPDAAFGPYVPALRKLDVPVCVLWGDGDPFLPVVWAEKQRDTFPSAEVHVLSGLGHWPFMDDLEAVSAQLLPFLRRVTG